MLLSPVAGGSGVVGFSGWVGWKGSPGLPGSTGVVGSSYRSREMPAPRRMVLPAKSAVLLLTSSAAPASCAGVVRVNSVSVPSYHERSTALSQRVVEKYSTMTCSSVTPSGRGSA